MVLATAYDWKHLAILSAAQAASAAVVAVPAMKYGDKTYNTWKETVQKASVLGLVTLLCGAPGGLIASYVMSYKSVPISKAAQ